MDSEQTRNRGTSYLSVPDLLHQCVREVGVVRLPADRPPVTTINTGDPIR